MMISVYFLFAFCGPISLCRYTELPSEYTALRTVESVECFFIKLVSFMTSVCKRDDISLEWYLYQTDPTWKRNGFFFFFWRQFFPNKLWSNPLKISGPSILFSGSNQNGVLNAWIVENSYDIAGLSDARNLLCTPKNLGSRFKSDDFMLLYFKLLVFAPSIL